MYQKTTLDSGLRLVTANMPHVPSISIGFFLGAGSRYENDDQAGSSHFIEHLCFKGTAKRPTAKEISMAIEGVGGVINGATDKEIVVYWCKVARPHFPIAIDVLTDMLLNSSFDPAEIKKERQVIIEEINMGRDSPHQRVLEIIDELMWPDHPLGRDIAGSKESVATIKRGMLLDYMAGQYQPANAVVSIAGDIKHEEMVAAVNQATANWKQHRPRREYAPYHDKAGKRVIIETRDTEQVQICLGLPGLSLLHPRRFTLDLLNVILGEGMSSRLFSEIRDRLGLVYSIHSSVDHFLDTGALIISAGVDSKNLRVAIKAILEELAKLKDTLPEAELARAKESSRGRLMLRMEDSRNVSGWMGGQEILTGRILSPDQVMDTIMSITAGEIQQLASDLLSGEKIRLAVVGPVAQDASLEDILKL